MLIVGGELIPIALNIVNDQNKLIKKVQKIVIFTRSKDMNQKYITLYPYLNISILKQFADLMRNFQKTIIDLELIRDEQNLLSFHREPDCSNFNESDGILIKSISQQADYG